MKTLLNGNVLGPAVRWVLALGWVAIVVLTVLFGLCAGCTAPNPDFEALTGPIRGGTVPGSLDGGAGADTGTAPDVTAPPRDGAPAPDFLAMQENGQPAPDGGASPLPGCREIVSSCAGQPRGKWCQPQSCSADRTKVLFGGACDGAGKCDYATEAQGGGFRCDPGSVCAAGFCPSAGTLCPSGVGCAPGSTCIEGVCRSCGGGM